MELKIPNVRNRNREQNTKVIKLLAYSININNKKAFGNVQFRSKNHQNE